MLEDARVVRVAVAVRALLAVREAADARGVGLGGDVDIRALHLAAGAAAGEPVTHPLLGGLAVVEGDRVQLGGVEKVGAELDRTVELRMRLRLLAVEAAPCHAANARLRDHHVRAAKLDLLQLVVAHDLTARRLGLEEPLHECHGARSRGLGVCDRNVSLHMYVYLRSCVTHMFGGYMHACTHKQRNRRSTPHSVQLPGELQRQTIFSSPKFRRS